MIKAMKAAGCRDWMTAGRYATIGAACKGAAGFSDVRLVVMGDDGQYWLTSARDAAKLRKAGYETI